MKSLHDVFTAIRDDEGDHVSTMEACLYPEVAKLSPSLERKALTAITAAVAIGMFLNTGADAGVGIDIVDAIDYAADETIASGLVDAAIAGIAVLTGVASTLKQEAKEGLFEEASFLGFRNTVGEIFRVISRLR